MEHFDVIIVGAGISGIGAGYHLQDKCPERSFTILEGRDNLGGTWDLFRYPGIRSDSDMYTLGFAFKPWTNPKAIADGPAILEYLHETAEQFGIDRKIRFGHYVKAAAWSSRDACWSVEVEQRATGQTVQFTCNFLHMCSGYYNYDHGYMPDFPGVERFEGPVVHPQHWPEDLDYTGKKVVVIGSGATAVTLVPAMAEKAEQVVMLQRSPTYIVSMPGHDRFAARLRRFIPETAASTIVRWRNILFGLFFFKLCRSMPERVKRTLIDGVRKELGNDFDVETHFTPTYNPWDQRLCLVPDGDLFAAIRIGKAAVVTDRIDTMTEQGVRLASGEELQADIIVSATGLEMQLMSDMPISVDGRPINPAECLSYKGMMFSDIPNLAVSFGYTNASWTLKADLTCTYVCRLLNYMAEHDYRQCCPRVDGQHVATEPFIDFSSGYVQRAIDRFPRQGSQKPWKVYQNYLLDKAALGLASVDDGVMAFSSPNVIRSGGGGKRFASSRHLEPQHNQRRQQV